MSKKPPAAYPEQIRERHERERLKVLDDTARRYRDNVTAAFRQAVAIKAGFARGADPDLSELSGE